MHLSLFKQKLFYQSTPNNDSIQQPCQIFNYMSLLRIIYRILCLSNSAGVKGQRSETWWGGVGVAESYTWGRIHIAVHLRKDRVDSGLLTQSVAGEGSSPQLTGFSRTRVGSMSGQRHRRRPDFEPALARCLRYLSAVISISWLDHSNITADSERPRTQMCRQLALGRCVCQWTGHAAVADQPPMTTWQRLLLCRYGGKRQQGGVWPRPRSLAFRKTF